MNGPLGSEGDPGDTGIRFPPPVLYVAGFLIGVGIELAFPISRPPLACTLAAVVIGTLAWLALDGVAMLSFRRAGTSMMPMNDPTTALVSTGPYRFTRNPMYLGMAFLYVAIAFALGLIWPLAVLPLVMACVDRLVVVREEAYLVRKFGRPYQEYMRQTRRWL